MPIAGRLFSFCRRLTRLVQEICEAMGASEWMAHDVAGIPEFQPPSHTLDEVRIKVSFAKTGEVFLSAFGDSQSKRGSLWSFYEEVGSDEGSLKPGDLLAHLVTVVVQDRPNSPERLDFSLSGGLGWEDVPLF